MALAKKMCHEVLSYGIFNPVDISMINVHMKMYAQNFTTLTQFVRNLSESTQIGSQKVHNIDINQLDPSLHSHQTIITHACNGNSFWSSLSLFLVGTEELRMSLRMLTAYKECMLGKSVCESQFFSRLHSARNDKHPPQGVHIWATKFT